MIELFHVAPVGVINPRQRFSPEEPAGLNGLGAIEHDVFKSLVGDDTITKWGEAMLLDSANELAVTVSPLLADAHLATSYEGSVVVSSLGQRTLQNSRNRIIDLVFELVRANAFIDKPSRWASLFGYRSLAAAREYCHERRSPQTHEIWRVAVDDNAPIHDADGGWLSVPKTALLFVVAAHCYWTGTRFPGASLPCDQESLVTATALR